MHLDDPHPLRFRPHQQRADMAEMAALDRASADGPQQQLDVPAVRIRHIRAVDYLLMRAFVSSLSRDTAYKRLLSGRTPTDDELRRWTSIDRSREDALVALGGTAENEKLVGVARYVIESDGEADFAIVLADAWQGRGLGRELLARLIAAAKQAGVRKLSGITLSTNVAMLSLARQLGFGTRRLAGAIATAVYLDLTSTSSPIEIGNHD